MMASPRQAPSGAAERPEASAANTPSIAIATPKLLRRVRGSMPSSAPTVMVCTGSVESARLARCGRRVADRDIVENEEQSEEADAESGDG